MRLFAVLTGLLLASASFANIVKESFFIPGSNPGLLRLIKRHPELTLDHMSSNGFELHGPDGTKDWLDSLGVDYRQDSGSRKLKSAAAGYPDFERITAELKTFANKHSDIMRLFSIGRSVDGRELWMVKISDNVQKDETEPEFKYISSMHGDEITGRELTRFWIADLLEGYGNDKEITELVDNTEIYVMPSMNPDGSASRSRGNANWVDLNRNFPDWTGNDPNTGAGRQPETRAVMRFQEQRNFALSANFHGGAVVVNYPWDSTYERHPFDGLIRGLSLDYADLNPGMRNSREFEDGVTNGADWYLVKGGMQDWSYHWHNDLQVTIELSQRKWPAYSQIPAFYEDNKESMFAFAKAVHQGAGFKLSSAVEGRVRIYKIEGSKKIDKGSYGFQRGEFYKVLPAGRYQFKVEAQGEGRVFEARVEDGKPAKNGNYTFL